MSYDGIQTIRRNCTDFHSTTIKSAQFFLIITIISLITPGTLISADELPPPQTDRYLYNSGLYPARPIPIPETPFLPIAEGGTIHCITSDRQGGFYLGGNFTRINGINTGPLAHVTQKNTIDPVFNPPVWQNSIKNKRGIVTCMTLSKNGKTLYIGGEFNYIGTLARTNVAAISPSTGLPTEWSPTVDGKVSAMAIGTFDSKIFIAGNFKSVNGQPRNYLASITTHSGALTPWNPSPDGCVMTLILSGKGDILYVSGTFTEICKQPRMNLAAVKTDAPILGNWNPNSKQWIHSLLAPDTDIASLF